MFVVIYNTFNGGFQSIPIQEMVMEIAFFNSVICNILLNSIMRICHFVTYLTFYNPDTQSEVTPPSVWMKCLHILLCSHQETSSAKISACPSQFLSKVHNQKLAQTFVYHPFHIQKLSETHLIKHKNNSVNVIREADEHSMSGPLNLQSEDALLSHC